MMDDLLYLLLLMERRWQMELWRQRLDDNPDDEDLMADLGNDIALLHNMLSLFPSTD